MTGRDVIVSLTVTDDSVFSKIEDRKQPASLGASVYLENEVYKNDYEVYYANQYINHWFDESLKDSKDSNLDLLLGVQGWRAYYFDICGMYNISQNINNMTEADLY